MEVIERRVECVTFLLLGRTNKLTLNIVWRIVWSLGTKCLSPPAAVAIATEKPSVAIVESKIMTDRLVVVIVMSLSTEVLQSSL